MPYPFARGLFCIGEPIWVPADATETELERKRVELEQTLNQLTLTVEWGDKSTAC